MEKTEKKGKKSIYIFLTLLLAVAAVTGYKFISPRFESAPGPRPAADSTKIDTTQQYSPDFLKAVVLEDSSEQVVRVSDESGLKLEYGEDENAGKNIRRVFTGRRINIIVTGVDSRLGDRSKHADANHVISILVDSGKIEMTAIPRDSYVDAGYPDSTGLNELTYVRANFGRERYLQEAAKIAGLDKIHYWAEVGFSQAMGILEFLGFKNSGEALQVLRNRKGLGGDDYQRVYNQAQFIRQMMIGHFNKLDGILGDIILSGGLSLIETNLTHSAAKDIIAQLRKAGFPKKPSDVSIVVRPPIPIKYKVFDFTDPQTIATLTQRIERFNKWYDKKTGDTLGTHCTTRKRNFSAEVASRLDRALRSVAADTSRKPQNVINKLRTYFDQHAWFQITDQPTRARVRDEFARLLSTAYYKQRKPKMAKWVMDVVENEKKMLANPLSTSSGNSGTNKGNKANLGR